MKFPRNAKLLRNQLDVTPFAAVFFLLVIFLVLGALLPTPGLPLRLPAADDLPGTENPPVSVAVDANNRLYFANQIIDQTELASLLKEAVANSKKPLTLVIQADKAVAWEHIQSLVALGRKAGINDFLGATLPRMAPENRPAAPR